MKPEGILVALDGSERSRRTVEYVASRFSLKDVRVALFYVLPAVPPQFWDDGHILSPAEKEERQKVIDRWIANRKSVLAPLLEEARRVLVEKGADPSLITTTMRSDMVSVDEAILEEAASGGYGTVVLGRHGAGHKGRHLGGNVATTVLHKAEGLTVCIVG
jgi:nucleotide-binding universal stress UspA family protein